MGEYRRLNNMIADHKGEIETLKAKLAQENDESKRDEILESIYDLQISIGEIEGALLEMADMDGLDDPYEAFD